MEPLVWALVSDQAGDNAQVLALAEELGLPFEVKPVTYTWRRRLPGNNRRVSLFSLDRASRQRLKPPWPDLLIMVGPRSQPIGRWVKSQSGGRTKLVLIGRPRTRASAFELIFDTRQYRLPVAPNVRLLPLGMSRYREPVAPTEEESAWLESLPRPHLLLMVGGPIRSWNFPPSYIAQLVQTLLDRARRRGGSLIVAGSPRTPQPVLDRLRNELAEAANARLAGDMPRFPVLIADAAELFPTGDSVSMISESVVTSKPVGIVMPRQTLWGRFALGPEPRMNWSPFRDLRRFWNYLREQGLVGTIEEPIGGTVDNPVVTAAREVRDLLDLGNE
jgi:uncharacterized protein